MDKRKLIGILIIIIGLIALIGIIYVVFFYNFTAKPKEVSQDKEPVQQSKVISTQKQPQELSDSAIITAKINQSGKIKVTEDDLKRMAAAFAERFGSYSNQSDYGNMRGLKIFMSKKMQAWADDFIKQDRAKKIKTSIYYGITTKAIAQEVNKFDKSTGQAEILVKAQRREAIGTANNATTFYQDIIVRFIREKDIWKVDQAEWQ
ncbi:MAG: hypothetical protein U9R14_03110 [Patescibacteria group bacterium]|nr:hypothetical protein [Patescibacteria group bacterium]